MDNRLIDLETKFAFAEQTLETLNQVVVEQQTRLEKLETDLERLRRQIGRTEAQQALDADADERA
jgi:SlyX protein